MGIFGNFDKPGPGIEKNAPKKKGIALFFDVYLRAFWELLKLNMLYLLFCIPIITIGPATAAMTKVTMLIVRERPFFVFGDFFEAFKSNFKQSFVTGLLLGASSVLLFVAMQFYWGVAAQNKLMYVIAFITVAFAFMLAMASIYIYPMLVTMALPLKLIYKNSLLLSVVCLKHSLPALVVVGLFAVGIFCFLPFSIPLLLVWFFSFAAFVSSFAAWPGIEQYVVNKE